MTEHTIPANAAEVLDRTIELLSLPANWTTDHFARNALNEAVDVRSPTATCFCIMGAIERVTRGPLTANYRPVGGHEFEVECAAESALQTILTKQYGDSNIANFNDTATHEQVMKALKQAREIA